MTVLYHSGFPAVSFDTLEPLYYTRTGEMHVRVLQLRPQGLLPV